MFSGARFKGVAVLGSRCSGHMLSGHRTAMKYNSVVFTAMEGFTYAFN